MTYLNLTTLTTLCKFGLDIRINNHRCLHQSVAEYCSELVSDGEILPSIFYMMEFNDTIIEIQAFPHNSNNSITIYHYDIDMALAIMKTLLS